MSHTSKPRTPKPHTPMLQVPTTTPHRVHAFDTTGEAYDACQCRDDIATGDTLVVEKEGVVGIAWAWPVAVSAAAMDFHTVETASTITQLVDSLACANDPEASHFRQAILVARERGIAICPRWASWMEAIEASCQEAGCQEAAAQEA